MADLVSPVWSSEKHVPVAQWRSPAAFAYLLNRGEHGQTQVLLTGLRGRDSSNHLGTVLQGLLGVESSLNAEIAREKVPNLISIVHHKKRDFRIKLEYVSIKE